MNAAKGHAVVTKFFSQNVKETLGKMKRNQSSQAKQAGVLIQLISELTGPVWLVH